MTVLDLRSLGILRNLHASFLVPSPFVNLASLDAQYLGKHGHIGRTPIMVAFKFRLKHLNLLVGEPRPALLVLLQIALALAALFGGGTRGRGVFLVRGVVRLLLGRVVFFLDFIFLLLVLNFLVVNLLFFVIAKFDRVRCAITCLAT